MKANLDKTVVVNEEQKLFVIPCGSGCSCLGFDVLETRANALHDELVKEFNPLLSNVGERGTLDRYAEYEAMQFYAFEQNQKSGWRSNSELTPELIGLEGKRVELTLADGTKTRFQVGKSTGYIPVHIALARRNCHGGPPVCIPSKIQSVRVIR